MSCVASATLTSFLWQEGGARPSLYDYCTVRCFLLCHQNSIPRAFGVLVSVGQLGGYLLRLVAFLQQLPLYQLLLTVALVSVTVARLGRFLQLLWLAWALSVTMARWALFSVTMAD